MTDTTSEITTTEKNFLSPSLFVYLLGYNPLQYVNFYSRKQPGVAQLLQNSYTKVRVD